MFQPNQEKKCLFAQLDRPTTNQSNVVCDVADWHYGSKMLWAGLSSSGIQASHCPKHLRETLSDQIVTLDGISLGPSSTVKNLRVMFYPHIKQVSRKAFFHLRNIMKIRNILSQKDAEKLVHAFVTSRLD